MSPAGTEEARARVDEFARRQGFRAADETPRAVELNDFLAMEFPPRQWLLRGLIQAKDANMIHAWRGVGKSRFALGLAVAVASGGRFLRWEAPEPRGVLVVDGELPREDLQQMLAEQVAAADPAPTAPLRILSRDMQEFGPLTSPAGQAVIEANLEGVDLVVLDNISTLGAGGNENDSESWDGWQDWIQALRRGGWSPLLVHHEGKGGRQRGTSRREDVLAQVVQLTRPPDYQPSEGARFEVKLTKNRHALGEDAEPIEAALATDEAGRAVWTWQPLKDARARQARKMRDEGLSYREIAKELGVGLATVNRDLKGAVKK